MGTGTRAKDCTPEIDHSYIMIVVTISKITIIITIMINNIIMNMCIAITTIITIYMTMYILWGKLLHAGTRHLGNHRVYIYICIYRERDRYMYIRMYYRYSGNTS